MHGNRITHLASALLVFVQQLSHLLDRERCILSVERLLALALVQKGTGLCIPASRTFLIRSLSVACAARSLSCVGNPRISHCVLRRSVECAPSAIESPRMYSCAENCPVAE